VGATGDEAGIAACTVYNFIMPALWWSITLLLMFVGLVGTVLPLLPGTTIILAAAILHHFMLGTAESVGWWTIGGLTVLTLLSYALELISGTLGAKWFGATRWGALGGILGAIVGLFFGSSGSLSDRSSACCSGRSSGAKGCCPRASPRGERSSGTGAGMIGKFLIAVLMIGWFLLAALM
jgi:uncharacterized protein YqgC (DUF456 family)